MHALSEALTLAGAAETAAEQEHQRLAGEHATATAAHVAAVEVFTADPTDRAGKDALRARDAAELAGHVFGAAARRLDAARLSRAAAEGAVNIATAGAAVTAAEDTRRVTRARAEELRATAKIRTVGARIARALEMLAADKRKALDAAAAAEEQSTASARDLASARDRLAALSPDFAAALPGLLALDAAEDAARLAHVGSVPGLVEQLAHVAALRVASAKLAALAAEEERAAIDDASKVREELDLEPLDFRSHDGAMVGAAAFAAAYLLVETRGRRPADFQAVGRLLGGWPGSMDPAEAWPRIVAGEAPRDLRKLMAERGHVLGARSLASDTDAHPHPVGKAHAAVREITHGRTTGAWVRPGREAELLALFPAALQAARDMAKKGTGFASVPGPRGVEHVLVPDAKPDRQVTEILQLAAAGLTLADVARLAPPAPPAAAAAAA